MVRVLQGYRSEIAMAESSRSGEGRSKKVFNMDERLKNLELHSE
jgi:hypothetical protein